MKDCETCQLELSKERKSLITDYRESLKQGALGERAETQHEIKVNRRMRFMYELKRTLVQDPLNSILITGGDNWPAQKKMASPPRRKERYRKLKREETKYSSNKSSLHIKVNPAEPAEQSEEDFLEKRTVSFGLNQQPHQNDHLAFFKKPGEKIDEDPEIASSQKH